MDHIGFPKSCDICIREKVNKNLFEGNIELDLKPVKGSNPSVLLLGQDPTIAKGKVYSVLDLENSSGSLYRYIVSEILTPSGLSLQDIYATDLIKCRFPDNQTPKIISGNHNVTIKDFIAPFFHNCRKWLFEEIRAIRPTIVLSLGEPVHQLLKEEFRWDIPTRMKDAFGNVYGVNLIEKNIHYIPCIHINSKHHRHYKNLWNQFIQVFREAVISAGIR